MKRSSRPRPVAMPAAAASPPRAASQSASPASAAACQRGPRAAKGASHGAAQSIRIEAGRGRACAAAPRVHARRQPIVSPPRSGTTEVSPASTVAGSCQLSRRSVTVSLARGRP